MLLTLCPDLFCPYFINDYMRKNAPKDYYVVGMRDYWKMLVGGLICQISKRLIEYFTKPFFRTIAKEKDNVILREIYAKKASIYLYKFFYFSMSSYWAWSVLNPSGYLWPQLGGTQFSKPLA